MKATITDVAKKAGVSIKTVSRVLNNEPNVAKTTRERVKAISAELRYSPNIAARGLATSKSYLIALIYDNASPNYLSHLQLGAIDACRQAGYPSGREKKKYPKRELFWIDCLSTVLF